MESTEPSSSTDLPALEGALLTALDPAYIEQAELLLAKDAQPVPDFWVSKYKADAAKNWNVFYKRNTTNFYKDRHWTDREFPELAFGDEHKVVCEVGCGVGNFIFPLMRGRPNMFAYVCDFAESAISLVKQNEHYDTSRILAFVADLTKDDLMTTIPESNVDILSMVFVLSAIAPESMDAAVANIAKVVKPGGVVLFRDYARYDQAQLRFKPGRRLQDHLYVRQDGTMAFYFTTELLAELFERHGFEVESNVYIVKEVVNRKQDVRMDRIFVQAHLRRRQ
ncbi:methyltransferase like 6 [Blastocladiella britannica]|nr:methyltransferase like 6 [Blastocladiella britannica]